ncbi:MAG: hypothetical protein P1U86_21680 [Verrucomicrobiales bacterium]|nr:hypothetical protein [Verrucomicrobiales bacterium]
MNHLDGSIASAKSFPMSQMHQMQLSYVSTEDRLLFRMNTKARQEFRFWMTRRYVSILWNTLTKMVNENREVKPERLEQAKEKFHDALAESAKAEIDHKEKVAKADFATAYQESTYLPLGEDPAVLFSVGVKQNPEGQAMICMHPEKGQGIEMVMNDQILHSLCKLIADTTTKAGWNLNLTFVDPKDSDDTSSGLN